MQYARGSLPEYAMPMIRLCKAALVAAMAIFMSLVVFGNATDYGTNWAFVEHVLTMDTIFPDSTIRWRAITDERVQTIAYLAIIAWQAATAVALWLGFATLVRHCRTAPAFARSKRYTALGLSMGFLLYAVGFLAIGGEWFGMWQSRIWNAQSTALGFSLVFGVVMIVLLIPDPETE